MNTARCWWFHGLVAIVAFARATGVYAQQDDSERFPFIVDSVDVVALDLFEGQTPWPILGPVMDFFHAKTRERVVRDEIFIQMGDTITQRDIDELQYRLRGIGAFADITITCAEGVSPQNGARRGRLQVRTRDTWSILLYASFTRSQDELSYSLAVTEFNLLGTANRLGLGFDYSSLGTRGTRWYGIYRNSNLFGSFLTLDLSGVHGMNEKSASAYIGHPFYSDRVRHAYAVAGSVFEGMPLVYRHRGLNRVGVEAPVRTVDASGWYSRSNGGRGDVFRWGASIAYDRTHRDTLVEFIKAFENSVRFFLGIASHRRRFTFIQDADFNGERQVPIGAYGSVSIGKIAPHTGGLDNVAYVGFDAGRSIREGNFYGMAEAAAGTAFQDRQTLFTTVRWALAGAILFNPGAVVVRVDQSTVWNWPRYLAAFSNGGLLRGYTREELASDNKLVGVAEYRLNPIVRLLAFDLGAVAFYEVGGYWDQGAQFGTTRFHSSAGIGVRAGYAGSRFGKGLLRIDLAWNFDRRSLSKILIGTEEAFDVFGALEFRPPGPYTY